MKAEKRNYIQEAVLQELRQPQCRVPDGWPQRLRCPNCKETQPTNQYKIVSRAVPDPAMLNIVVICLKWECKHIFSPTPEYLALMQQGVSGSGGVNAASSPNGRT